MVRKLGLLASAGLLFGGLSVATATLVIDHYDTGVSTPDPMLATLGGATDTHAAATALGGSRYLLVASDDLAANPDIKLQVNNGGGGFLDYISDTSDDGYARAGYGTIAGVTNLNQSVVGDDMFHFDFSVGGSDAALLSMWVTQDGLGTYSVLNQAVAAGTTDAYVLFSSFVAPVSLWGDVDEILYELDYGLRGDSSLHLLETTVVPEPSSLALLGLFGVAAGLVRRRRA